MKIGSHEATKINLACKSPGILLVFAENKGYIKGLYVSPRATFVEAFDSGLSFTYRSETIGIVEIKKRIFGKRKETS